MLKILKLRRKANSQKPKQKKQHLYHHCGTASHTWPNCYMWLATQQSNSMIVSGSQNQLQSSLAPFGDLLKALMFLSNLNGFNSSPLPPIQGFRQRKGSSKVWKKKDSKWFYHFLLSSCFCLLHYFCVCVFFFLSQSSFMFCFVYHVFVCLFSVFGYFVLI